MILAVIAACEIAFWVFLAAGLAARYLLRRRRLSVWLLALAPTADVVLLVATAVSLRRGDDIGLGHALAAVYIGFSVAYGHRLIAWADVRFAHRFAGGPAPVRPTGREYTKLCWGDVGRTALAAAIASGLTAALVLVAPPGSDTGVLQANFRWMGFIFVLDLLWAISYTLWPRRAQPAHSRSSV